MKISKEYLINPPKKYRPAPFWSWNSKLEVDETLFQIEQMDKVGMGGFFMHARGGLKTEYMSDEWMDNIRASVVEGKKRSMEAFGYDENGWPSGFGSGMVNSLGIKYQQKYIKMSVCDEEVTDEFTISNQKNSDGKIMHFYFDVNPFYIDAMDGEVTDEFIRVTHAEYKKALGEDFGKMSGFFTDEPQLSRADKAIPWSLILPEEYEREYNEALIPNLKHLFITSKECYETRYKYWRLVTKLFSENYMKRIYTWCEENNMRLTGHMVCEESYVSQLDSNGSVMPSYMYMHIPGVDKLCRQVNRDLLTPQVTSVCAQMGRKQILTESFALCGWDVSFEELKWVFEWQMVKGVNYLCQHLSGYSLKGIRKRDYPANHFYQNPWWNDYKMFNDFVARMGMLLAEGDIKCEVLVLNTISSAWINRCDDHDWRKEIGEKFDKPITDILICLDKNQILYHIGDEIVMEKLASVNKDVLKVGKMEYKAVIVPSSVNMSSFNYKLLKKFKENGGNVIFCGNIPLYIDGVRTDAVLELAGKAVNNIEELPSLIDDSLKYISLKHYDSSSCDIQYAQRKFDGYTMYYFVNTYSTEENAVFRVKGKSLAEFNYLTGEVTKYPYVREKNEVTAEFTLKEKGSIVFFVYDEEEIPPLEEKTKTLVSLNDKLRGEWRVSSMEKNALTLDCCDVYFDGEKKFENFHVIDIEEIANDLKRKVNIRLDFKVKSDTELEGETFLVIEEPEFYSIIINGREIEKKYCGYFRDKAFIKLDVSGLIKNGENVITLITDFVQPRIVYDMIDDAHEFEAMKNKLWYDREIENIYLLGDFCVKSQSEFEPAENNSLVTNGEFILTNLSSKVNDGDMVRQGFPFFTGKIKLEKTISLTKDETKNRAVILKRMGSVITKLTVNGVKLPPLVWAPYEFELSGLLKEGDNKFEFELTSNFRNLFGPFHLGFDSYSVSPASFYKSSEIFKWGRGKWYDSYAFLETGIFLK